MLKKFVILLLISFCGFFVGAILHNVFYALAILAENIVILRFLAEAFSVVFFLISVIICPIGFIVSIIGIIFLLAKKTFLKLSRKFH